LGLPQERGSGEGAQKKRVRKRDYEGVERFIVESDIMKRQYKDRNKRIENGRCPSIREMEWSYSAGSSEIQP